MLFNKKKQTYMIGQRVILHDAICVICLPENDSAPNEIWVDNPAAGHKHWVNRDSIKPLPNNQL